MPPRFPSMLISTRTTRFPFVPWAIPQLCVGISRYAQRLYPFPAVDDMKHVTWADHVALCGHIFTGQPNEYTLSVSDTLIRPAIVKKRLVVFWESGEVLRRCWGTPSCWACKRSGWSHVR